MSAELTPKQVEAALREELAGVKAAYWRLLNQTFALSTWVVLLSEQVPGRLPSAALFDGLVDMPLRERQLYDVLADGEAHTRAELEQAMWGQNRAYYSDNALSATLSRLRKRLGPTGRSVDHPSQGIWILRPPAPEVPAPFDLPSALAAAS
jgi:hypothetical protein